MDYLLVGQKIVERLFNRTCGMVEKVITLSYYRSSKITMIARPSQIPHIELQLCKTQRKCGSISFSRQEFIQVNSVNIMVKVTHVSSSQSRENRVLPMSQGLVTSLQLLITQKKVLSYLIQCRLVLILRHVILVMIYFSFQRCNIQMNGPWGEPTSQILKS